MLLDRCLAVSIHVKQQANDICSRLGCFIEFNVTQLRITRGVEVHLEVLYIGFYYCREAIINVICSYHDLGSINSP